MSDQPKPTGEWTAEYIEVLMARNPLSKTVGELYRQYKVIADSHNAAIAAERESFWRDRDKWNELHQQLREQLAAEREKYNTLRQNYEEEIKWGQTMLNDLTAQLAAERTRNES